MKLNLVSGKQLIIKLIDSPLIHQWAIKFCTLQLDETEVSSFSNRKSKFDQAKFNELYTQLNNGIRKYDHYADYWTEEVVEGTDHLAIQKLLNDLHHWCVEQVCLEHKRSGAPGHAERVQEFGELNSLCHQCETMLVGGNRDLPKNCQHIYWDQQVVHHPDDRMLLTEDWLKLMTTDKHDMYIAKRILGKDYRECYRDYDDALRTEMMPFGDKIPLAFEFDPLNNWKDLTHSQKFIDWLYESPSEYNVGRIPVGNLTQKFSDEELHKIIRNDKIKEITIE